MLFFENIHFQIAAVLVILVLQILYWSQKKLPLLSTTCFSFMMFWSAVYIVADFAVVFSLAFPREVSHIARRFFHQLFYFSIENVCLFLYLYVTFLLKKQERLKAFTWISVIVPYALTIIALVFSPIKYVIGSDAIYPAGPMVRQMLFLSSIYMLFALAKTLSNYKKNCPLQGKKRYIVLSVCVWFCYLHIQILFPRILFSSLCISLVVFFMYIAYQKPIDCVNAKRGIFDNESLELILQEMISRKNTFEVINFYFSDLPGLRLKYGKDAVNELFNDMSTFVAQTMDASLFRTNNNGFAIVASIVDNDKSGRIVQYLRYGANQPNNFRSTKEEIHKRLDEMQKRFNKAWPLLDTKVFVTPHIDIIAYPNDLKTATEIIDMLGFITENPALHEHDIFAHDIGSDFIQTKRRQDEIVKLLSEAIHNDGFDVYFQPIYSVEKKRFISAEALVRLKDTETIGYVSPEEFIPLAEKHGLINAISNLIFEKVFGFMQSSGLCQKGVEYIELNLSGLQCIDADLPEQIENMLKKYQLAPSCINLEITESAAVANDKMLSQNMQALGKMGCTFSMDDFGTGYSNLAQMVKADFDIVKIDKSLVWPCFDDSNPDKEKANIVLQTVVKMVLNLGGHIVAEGVETLEQVETLEKLGVNYLQGYYFSKPVCMNEYLEFLQVRA